MGGLLCLSFKDVYGAMGLKLQQVVVWTILEQLRSRMLADQVHEELRVLVVIDEGHRFIQLAKMVEGGIEISVEPPLSLHLRDVRKFGVGYIVVTHNPSDMPEGVIPLFGTTVAMSSSNVDYLDWAMRNLQLTPAQRNELGKAGLGRGYMLWMDDPRPLLVVFEPERRAMLRDMVAERTRMLLGERGERPAPTVARPTLPPIKVNATIRRPNTNPPVQMVRSPDEKPTINQPEIEKPQPSDEKLVEKIVEEVVRAEDLHKTKTPPSGASTLVVEMTKPRPNRRSICPRCHRRIPSWAKFCSHCGYKLSEVKVRA